MAARTRRTKNTTRRTKPKGATVDVASLGDGAGEIIETDVETELADSFMEYALAVIISRAIPDARDGLKPVQRRILYAMLESGLRSDRPHRKSVSAVSETMKNYHPHGDAAIYDTLVRLAQHWSLQVPLVDGHGNFGSLDDGAAAARYCVTGDTLIRHADGITAPIADIVAADPDTSHGIDMWLLGAHGEKVHASRLFHSGDHPTIAVTTADGYQLTGTANHPILTAHIDDDGNTSHRWTLLEAVKPGDVAVIAAFAHDHTCNHTPDQTVAAAAATLTGDTPAADRRISAHLHTSGPATKRAYLTAAFERDLRRNADGTSTYHARSADAARSLHQLLLEFGIPSHLDTVTLTVTCDTAAADQIAADAPAGSTADAIPAPSSYHYTPIVAVEPAGTQPVYSVRVDTDDHAFITNGFISHNTEARLSSAAELLLGDVDENTVDMVPNFEQTRDEPTVLPAAFPNLLVNGATGIAVGMATDIPPHNLGEAVAAAKLLLDKPKATLDELIELMPAPDFPTGGILIGTDGVRDAYETGRGKFLLRARASIEDVSARRRGIVVTELPYSVGPEKVISRIKQLVNAKRIDGIADVRDLTDRRSGLRLVIECKPSFDPEAVLAALYRLTPLQISCNVNAVALIGSKPELCDLRTMLSEFIRHRLEVVVRRTKFRLERAEARLHIVEGLIVALDAIDTVVDIIRASKDTPSARAKLMKTLKLTEIQADHILEMPLRRLTSLETAKLHDERKALGREIAGYNRILSSPKRQREIVAAELDEAAAVLATPRRTQIVDADDLPEPPPASKIQPEALELADTPCDVIATSDGTIARIDTTVEPTKRKAPTPLTGIRASTTTKQTVIAITSDGRGVAIDAAELPVVDELAPRAKTAVVGAPAGEFCDLEPGQRIVGFAHHGDVVAFGTADGVIKRLSADGWPSTATLEREGPAGVALIAVADGDHVVAAQPAPDGTCLTFITAGAQLLRFDATQVRPQGRTAAGMAGIRLAGDDQVICFAVAPAEPGAVPELVAVATDAANAKTSLLHDYPTKGRGTAGVRCITFKKADSRLATAAVLAANPGEIVAVAARQQIDGFDATPARRDASGTELAATPEAFTVAASR